MKLDAKQQEAVDLIADFIAEVPEESDDWAQALLGAALAEGLSLPDAIAVAKQALKDHPQSQEREPNDADFGHQAGGDE